MHGEHAEMVPECPRQPCLRWPTAANNQNEPEDPQENRGAPRLLQSNAKEQTTGTATRMRLPELTASEKARHKTARTVGSRLYNVQEQEKRIRGERR